MHPKRRKTAKNICENSAIELVKIFNTIQIILTEKKHFYVFLRNKQFFPTWLFDQLNFFYDSTALRFWNSNTVRKLHFLEFVKYKCNYKFLISFDKNRRLHFFIFWILWIFDEKKNILCSVWYHFYQSKTQEAPK